MAKRLQEAGVPRELVHLSAHGAAADAGVVPADVGAGEDQRGVRAGQDKRPEILRVPQPPVRHGLHLCDADKPLRAQRQLPSGALARASGAHPPLPRGEGGGANGGDVLGRRLAAPRVPLRRRPGEPLRVPDEQLFGQRDGECRYGEGADHQGTDGACGFDSRLRGEDTVGHDAPERHSEEAARRK